ncbi:cell wall serine-threonine-rich galactomannoprotein Mp1 [Apiospora kogelbergensis]|uniref:cell wall serine-threonine-rich galactomannoprotein Mp1 n=1 Tax=Apiospora kogelbergensis TaxID=1337665 RepID=UPI003131F923
MATGTIATFGDAAPPSKTPRATPLSGAMSQLDVSIKAYDGGDASKVKSDTDNLVSTIKSCAKSLKDGGKEIALQDISALQPLMSGINTIGQGLAGDFEKKKTQFEQSELCTIIQGGLQSIGKETKKLMDGVVGKCPQEAKSVASSLGDGVVTTLTKGADLFKEFHCQPPNGGSKHKTSIASASASASASVPVVPVAPPPKQSAVAPPPVAAPVTVTATVTAPCACSSSAAAPPPPPAVPTTKKSTAAPPPFPTGPPKTTVAGSTGGVKPTSTGVPVVTAAAVPNAMAPMGVVAGLFALML